MSSSSAVFVDGLGKRYDIYDRPSDRLRQFVLPRLQRIVARPPQSYAREFWALRDVSFEIQRGDALGVIGRNGSGKSTLLQLITGVLTPTEGVARTNGRVAALLELGSGFNPDFTGRENVYLNGTVLGLSRDDLDRRFDAIAAFADIGDFMEQPVKTYSSGMFVRLAFAVIANVDADILVVDEALAVGDVFFTQKCMRFFKGFRERGGTTLFVSHDSPTVVNLCNRAIWLEKGCIQEHGEPENVCRSYLEQIYRERTPGSSKEREMPARSAGAAEHSSAPRRASSSSARTREVWSHDQRDNPIAVSPFNRASPSIGLGGAQIVDAGFFAANSEPVFLLQGGEEARLSVFVLSKKTITFPAVGLVIKDRLGQYVFTESSSWAFENYYEKHQVEFREGERIRVDFHFPMPVLIEGDYSITLAVAQGLGHDHVQHHLIHDAIALKSVGSRLAHGIAGFNTIKIKMTFFREEAGAEFAFNELIDERST